jgi:uncharacterized protein (DUF58 family)
LLPQPALIAALVAGAALGLLPILWPEAWVVVVAYVAAVVALAVIEAARLPGSAGLSAIRSLPRPLSLGARQRVLVDLEHPAAAGLLVQVADHAPSGLVPAPRVLAGAFDADGRMRAEYDVWPPHRGAYKFGRLDVRWRRRRGFWVRQAGVDLRETVAVYPNVLAVREYELRLRRGMLALTGIRRAKPPGATTAFSGLRDYVPGDELRRISWKASARADRPVTTVVEAERGQQAVIVVDCARLMTAPAGELTKLDHAVNAALLLAWVAQSQGDRVGLMTFSDGVRSYLSPQRGTAQVSRISQALYDVLAEYSEPDFGEALAFLAARLNRRSLVTILTDVLDPEASSELVDHVLRLSSRHLVLVVAMSDPEVLAARDSPIKDSRDAYRWAAAEELLAARRRSFEILRRGGVLGLDVRAGELSPRLVERYLEMKERALL